MLMQCSLQVVLPLHHLWTLLAVVSTRSFISASCCYCKRRHRRLVCECICLCVSVWLRAHSCLRFFCLGAYNKLSCWLLICMDKRSHNEPHGASDLAFKTSRHVCQSQELSSLSVTFALKFWTLNWHRSDRHAQAPYTAPVKHFQSFCLLQIIMSSAAAAAGSTWHTSVKLLSRLCECSDASSWFIFTGQSRSNACAAVPFLPTFAHLGKYYTSFISLEQFIDTNLL